LFLVISVKLQRLKDTITIGDFFFLVGLGFELRAFFETRLYCVAQDGLKLAIPLPQPPKC
jgi:hypothetical protein